MPVHHVLAGHVLLIKVDGDFTPVELQRVIGAALEDAGAGAGEIRVLLDLTGAASLNHRTDEDLAQVADHFGNHAHRFHRIALLMSGHLLDEMMRLGTAFASHPELHAAPFRDRAEAEEWVNAEG